MNLDTLRKSALLYMYEKKPDFQIDDQHEKISWFDLKEVASSSGFHKYIRNYASHLLAKGLGND